MNLKKVPHRRDDRPRDSKGVFVRREIDMEEVRRLYVDEELNGLQVAERLGVSGTAIYTRLRELKCLRQHKGGSRPGVFAKEKNPNWKGGRWIDGQGYWQCHHNGGYEREHRLVAAKILGRPLEGEECVHHINGDRLDNRPENLQVCKNNSEHIRKYHGKK